MKADTSINMLCHRPVVAIVMIVASLAVCARTDAAVIGVLDDGRQVEYLSLLGDSSAAARLALEQDGHTVITLPSLGLPVMNLVDVVWLPLLDSAETYTLQERINILQYVIDGGRVIWIGDADVFNAGDDSFLSTFGMSKLVGNLDAGLAPAPEATGYPVVTGPHGTVALVATDAGYGLFNSVAEVADVFAGANEEEPPETGTFAGFMDADSGFTGAGRVALVCDASIFGQGLDQEGQDHRVLLRNIVKWAEAAPGYTPSGAGVSTGDMAFGCGACTAVEMVFEAVATTGETTVSEVGSGRCGFVGVEHSQLYEDFVGYGFVIETTATFEGPIDVDITVTYDWGALETFGIPDESDLRVFWYDPALGTTIDVTVDHDPGADAIMGAVVDATDLGVFFLGAATEATDCDDNGVPDECDVDPTDPDGDGEISADCNANGVPDTCDVADGESQDCNENGVPDDCDVDPADPDGDGEVSADCNGNSVPDACDIADGNSADCNANGVPDTCDVADGNTPDCNENGVPDDCDVDPADPDGDGEVSDDCNANGVPDTCDTDGGENQDCNANGVPDDCDVDPADPDGDGEVSDDCNANGVPDTCDTDGGDSQDCNTNGVPDECESAEELAPEITQQPADQSACASGSATFTVVVDDSGPFAYQWRKDGVDIPDATDSEYTIDPVSPGDAGGYDVIVTNTCGSAISEIAALTVLTGPTISQQPVGRDACEGDGVTFNVAADGTGELSYQWKRGGEALFDGGSVIGATTDTLQLDPVNPNHVGDYTCEVTDDCGSLESEPATLTVGLLLELAEGPVDQFSCPGDGAVFSVSATGTGLIYQWQYDDGGGFQALSDGENIDGSTTDTLTIGDVTEAAAGPYRCSVAGACGEPVVTDAAELTVGIATRIDADPADLSACPGDDVSFSVVASGTGLTYQWQYDDGGGPVVLEDGGNISGADSDTLTISGVTEVDEGSYLCAVFGSCGPPVTSQTAALVVDVPPAVVDDPSDQWACPGDAVQFAVGASGTELAYQWQFDNGEGFVDLTDGEHVAGAGSSALTVSNVDAAAEGQYRCVVSGNCGSPVTSAAATLTVGSVVTIIAEPADQSACPGAEVAFDVGAAGSGLAYQWQFNDGEAFQDLVDGDGIAGATTDSLTIQAAAGMHQGMYRCAVSGSCGTSAYSEPAELTVSVGACDCNGNDVPDADDIADGTSQDCNGNEIPDSCDIADGTSHDCNGNAVPDDCDIAEGAAEDCDTNGIPDLCDIADGTSQDCNDNDIPDTCDVDAGTSDDCNGNGVPDECEAPYVADAGEPMDLCSGQGFVPLGGDPVASGSAPPYTYFWHVITGPEGGGILDDPTAEHPGFTATLEGVYEIELVVTDASQPPCVTTDTVQVTAMAMIIDAGESFAMCAESTSGPLSPTVSGGAEPYSYLWTVDDGSPSTSPGQFTGPGPQDPNPTFTPDAPGQYTLRLTVQDGNEPSCTVTDALTVYVMHLAIEAPDAFAMCVSAESDPLTVTPTSAGTEPLSYAWSIDDGSPSTDLSQFTGSGPDAADPTFTPISLGEYVLRVTVQDSSTPPCEQTATLLVSVGALTVDAGSEETLCVGSDGIRLAPTVEGGVGELNYTWSIEPGSPSVDPNQFTDPHHLDPSPLFIPSSLGSYTLRLTVTDSATPACSASDTMVIRATSMTVDAGEDFITQASRQSRLLGAIPVAGGGDPPFTYAWEILAGPSRDPAQLSATDVEHPFFTPASVGTHEVQVTVTDANGTGCAVSDVVVVEAIASRLTLPINVEGRLFMMLQIDAPHTRGEIRISEGVPGVEVTGELYDDGPAANFSGLLPTPDLSRRLYASAVPGSGAHLAVVILYYDDVEAAGVDQRALRLHRFVDPEGQWRLAGTAEAEEGSFPVRPAYSDLGRHGVDTTRNCVWAVVDYLGEFAIGIPSGEAPAGAEPQAPGVGSPAGSDAPDPAAPQDTTALCGAVGPCGAGASLPLMLGGLAGVTRLRHRRRRLHPRRCVE